MTPPFFVSHHLTTVYIILKRRLFHKERGGVEITYRRAFWNKRDSPLGESLLSLLTRTVSATRTERTARRRNHRTSTIRTHSLLFHAIPTSLENDALFIIPKRYFFARNKTPNAPVASQDAPERVFIAKWTKYMGVQNQCLKIHLKAPL